MPPSLTATKRLEWLQTRRDAEAAEITAVHDRAAADDRDLSDEENSACERRRAAIETYDRELAVEVETVDRQSAYATMVERIGPAITRSVPSTAAAEPEVLFRSAGEYLGAFLRARNPHGPDADAQARLDTYRQRANLTTANTPGLLPEPIVAPLIQTIDARRPAIDAATRRPLPNGQGRTFTRPIVSQHTAVAKQTAEKVDLVSQALTVDELQVTRETHGGTVNLSWQARDWTDPATLDVLLSDLSAGYAASTDKSFCAELVAKTTQTVSATTGATPAASDSASWLRAIYEAAAIIFAAGNAVPSTLWVAPDIWASLGAMVDGAGRPLFAAISPVNAMGGINPTATGGNVAGFALAVDGNFPAGEAIMGDAQNAEFYEQVGGLVSALEPTHLGTAVAFYGYAATCITRPDTFVRIVSVP